jgi:hypothetical protein
MIVSMSKRNQYIALACLLVVLVAAAGLFVKSQSDREQAPSVDQTQDVPVVTEPSATPAGQTAASATNLGSDSKTFKILNRQLPNVKGPNYECSSAGALKAKANEVTNSESGAKVGSFWESASTPNRFLYYENESRLLVVCDGKQTLAVSLISENEAGGLTPSEELVELSKPNFADWDGDGTLEFNLFYGQCVEGPCIGSHQIFRIKGNAIVEIAEIDGERIDVSVSPPDKTTLVAQPSCYDYDFGTAFNYVEVFKFGGPEVLTLVPFQQIKTAYPAALKEIRERSKQNNGVDVHRVAFTKIQDLVVKAYDGVGLSSLMKDYNDVVKTFPLPVNQDGEPVSDAPYMAPVHCDPPAILEMIAGQAK